MYIMQGWEKKIKICKQYSIKRMEDWGMGLFRMTQKKH